MLNLFGAIANGIGRMLPGYMNGYRMAIQDNWNDLNNYNKVQQGQINNAWLETSFNPMYNQLWYDTAMKQMAALGMRMNLANQEFAFPGAAVSTMQKTAAAPMLQEAQINDTMGRHNQNAFMREIEQTMAPGWMEKLNSLNWGMPQEQPVQRPSSVGLSGNPEDILRGSNGSFFNR